MDILRVERAVVVVVAAAVADNQRVERAVLGQEVVAESVVERHMEH